MAIANVPVGNTNTTIYNSSGDFLIATMIFCNTTNSTSANLTLYLVPSGGSVGTGSMIVNTLTIPPTETVFFDTEKLVLASGDTIVAISSVASTITCTISTVAI
jgi:hypothetical protein